MQRLLRPIAIISAAAYFLVVTAGVALHRHVHGHAGHFHAHVHFHAQAHFHGHAHDDSCDHHHVCHHDGEKSAPGTPEHDAPLPSHHDGDNCLVCEFFAQAPALVEPVALPPRADLVAPPVVPIAHAPSIRPFLCWQGRAPPTAGV